MQAQGRRFNALSLFRRGWFVVVACTLLVIGGCGGSGPRDQTTEGASPTFSGTIINDDGTAASAPTASAKAASGTERTSAASYGSTTTYTLDASALTGPYLLCYGSFNFNGLCNAQLALALQPGLVNITPLTTLQAEAIYGLAPQAIFTSFGSTSVPTSAVTTASLQAAQAKVLDFVQNTLGVKVSSGIGDFATSSFSATAGDPMFDTLASLAARRLALGASYDTLVAAFVNEVRLCKTQKISATIGGAAAADFCPATQSANRESLDPTIVDAAFVNQAGASLTVRVRDTVVLGATYQVANGGASYSCTGNACAITVSAADATSGGLPLTFVQSPLIGASASAVLNGTLVSAVPPPAPPPLPCPTTAAPVTLTVGGIALNDFCPASVAAPAETADPTVIDAAFADAAGSTLTVRVQGGTTVLGASYVSASGFSYACSGTACAITVGTAASSGALPITFSQSTLAGAADSAVVGGTLLSAVPGAAAGAPACLANATLFQLTAGGQTAVYCPSSKTAGRETADPTIVDAVFGNVVGTLTVRFHSDTSVVVDATYVDASSSNYACSGSACAIVAGTPDATTGAVPLTFAAATLTGPAGTAIFDGAVSTVPPVALLPPLSCTSPYHYFLILPNQSVLADCIQDQGADYGAIASGYSGYYLGFTDSTTYAIRGVSEYNPQIYVTLNSAGIDNVTVFNYDNNTGMVTLGYKCRGADCTGVTVGPPVDQGTDPNYGTPTTTRTVTFNYTKLAMVETDGSLYTSVNSTLVGTFTGLLGGTLQFNIDNFGAPSPASAADCAPFPNKVLTAPTDENYVYGSCFDQYFPTPPETLQKADGGLRLSWPPQPTNVLVTQQSDSGYVVVVTDTANRVTDVTINNDALNSGIADYDYWGCSGNCSGVTVSTPDSSGNYTVTFSNAPMHYIEPDGFPTGVRTATVNGTFVAPPPTPGVVIASTRSNAASRRRLMLPRTLTPHMPARAASAARH